MRAVVLFSAAGAVSGALVSVGVGMMYLPAGLIVAGLLGFVALYVVAYLSASSS